MWNAAIWNAVNATTRMWSNGMLIEPAIQGLENSGSSGLSVGKNEVLIKRRRLFS